MFAEKNPNVERGFTDLIPPLFLTEESQRYHGLPGETQLSSRRDELIYGSLLRKRLL